MSNTSREYKGYLIEQCSKWVKGDHAGKWVVVGWHHADLALADELLPLPHFHTLAEAQAHITERRRHAREGSNA